MRRSFLTYLGFLAALTQGTAPVQGQGIEGLRPADYDDAAAADTIPPQDNPSALNVPSPAEGLPAAKRRKVKEESDHYAPQGIGSGGLILYPSLQSGLVLSSNPEQRHSGADAALGVRLSPSLRIESDWSRHALSLSAEGTFTDYPGHGIGAESTGRIESDFRLDIRRTSQADFESSYAVERSSASDSEVPDQAEGDRIEHEWGGIVTLTHQPGRFGVRLRGGLGYNRFEDVDLQGGGTEDNSDRNYVQPEIGLRLSYEATPAITPFVEAAYQPRFHDEAQDRNGFRRDSDGYLLKAGAALDSSPIWSGELALLYEWRDYDDRRLETLDAVGVTGNVVWRPTEFTTLTYTAATSLDETVSAGSSGTRVYELGASAEHLLRDNVALLAGAGVEFDVRDGPNDVEFDGTLGVVYRFNPWLAWTASYDFTWFDSGFPQSDYAEHRLTSGIEIRR
jgi:hypothetical protein